VGLPPFEPARRFASDADTLLLLHFDGDEPLTTEGGAIVLEPDTGYHPAFCDEE
jgi:hypothetical protein